MKKKHLLILVALLLIALLIAGFAGRGPLKILEISSFAHLFRPQAEDEPPIIVKNGSVTIDTSGDAEWFAGIGQWINDTGSQDNQNELWARVIWDGGSCATSGKPVRVQHTDPTFQFNFVPARTVLGRKTVVTPKGQVDRDPNNPKRLTWGNPNEGYISAVTANSGSCAIAKEYANVKICICSSPNDSSCKQDDVCRQQQ